jgi:hypothetical protein
MSVEAKLRTQLILSSVLMTAMLVPTLYMLPESLEISFNPMMPVYHTTKW